MRGALLAAASAVILLGTVASAPAAEPAGKSGQQSYIERCGGCHLEGGFGTRVLSRRVPEGEAMLEKRSALPAAFVKLAVRRGIGSMPQIRPAELSDAELERIAQYLDKSQ